MSQVEVVPRHEEVASSSTDGGPLRDIEALLIRSLAASRSHREIIVETPVSFPALQQAVLGLCKGRVGWKVSEFTFVECDGETIVCFTVTRGLRTFSKKDDFRYKVHVHDVADRSV